MYDNLESLDQAPNSLEVNTTAPRNGSGLPLPESWIVALEAELHRISCGGHELEARVLAQQALERFGGGGQPVQLDWAE